MTGEITLRGKVLPVGGIKEKVIAAKSAGIKTVILPDKNEKDLEDVSPAVRERADVPVRHARSRAVLDIVFGAALARARAEAARDAAAGETRIAVPADDELVGRRRARRGADPGRDGRLKPRRTCAPRTMALH